MQPLNTIDIEPCDEAMDLFRQHFRLVAGCNVSEDGRVMTYNLKSVTNAILWESEAKQIIEANSLPLVAYTEKKEIDGEERTILSIIYNS